MRGLLPGAGLCLPVFVCLVVAATGGASTEVVSPVARNHDLVCAQSTDETTRLYLATQTGVLTFTFKGDAPSTIPLTAFTPVSVIDRTVILATLGDHVFACDPKRKRIWEMNVDGSLREILKDDDLEDATRLAVSSDATFAVFDAKSGKLRTYVIESDGIDEMKVKLHTAVADIVFDRSGPMILDTDGNVSALSQAVQKHDHDNKPELASEAESKNRELSSPTNLKSLVAYNGLLYGTTADQRMVIFSSEDHEGRAFIPFTTTSDARPAFSETQIFDLDLTSQVVRVRDRVVPATLAFVDDDGRNLSGAIAAYGILDGAGLLATREITTPRNGRTVEDLLFDSGVIVPAKSIRISGEAGEGPSAPELRRIFCSWNRPFCAAHATEDILKVPLASNESLQIPIVGRRTSVSYSRISLNGKTVERYLQERLSSEELRRQWPASRITALNPNYSRSVEGYFNRIGYILASPPRADFAPGSTLSIRGGSDILDVTCGRSHPRTESDLISTLPYTLTSGALDAVLPVKQANAVNILRSRNIVRAEVHYEDVSSETMVSDGAALSPCLRADSDRVFVREAVKANRVLIRLFDVSGRPVSLTPQDVASIGLSGHADPSGDWSVIVDEGIYVAYRADKLSSFDGELVPADVSIVKPNTRQDITSMSAGELTLPVERWHLIVPATVRELKNRESDLMRLHYQFGIEVRSHEPLASTAMMVVETPKASDEQLAREQMVLLRESIGYRDHVFCLDATPRIGIVEELKSIDFDHPAFFENGNTIWIDLNEFGEASPHQATPRAATGRLLKHDPVAMREHGTHVAGIIAAQTATVSERSDADEKLEYTGLYPQSRLVAIERLDSPAAIVSSLMNAWSNQIHVVGFSMGYKGASLDDGNLATILEYFKNDSYPALYVVAAGNDGDDLRESNKSYPPLGWVTPNAQGQIAWSRQLAERIIGVGALEGSDLLSKIGSDGKKWYESNYSKAHVQLLAPGRDVLSTAFNGFYGVGSGSSQAAPQVVAAAAALYGCSTPLPSHVKARLIYTAEPLAPSMDDKVWGGVLNVSRALSHLHRNVVTLIGQDDVLQIDPRSKTVKVILRGIQLNSPDASAAIATVASKEVMLKDVLRISNRNGDFRVIYLDDTRQMRIARVREVAGNLPCRQLKNLADDAISPLAGDLATRCEATKGIQWSEIRDYVAAFSELPDVEIRFTSQ